MKRIFKLNLAVIGSQLVHIPKGYELLSAGNQDEELKVWYVDTGELEKSTIEFIKLGTGDEIPDGFNYLSTVHFMRSKFIIHVYWREI